MKRDQSGSGWSACGFPGELQRAVAHIGNHVAIDNDQQMKVTIVVFVAVGTRAEGDAGKAAFLHTFSTSVRTKGYRLLVWGKGTGDTSRVRPLDQRDRSFPKLDVFLRSNNF